MVNIWQTRLGISFNNLGVEEKKCNPLCDTKKMKQEFIWVTGPLGFCRRWLVGGLSMGRPQLSGCDLRVLRSVMNFSMKDQI